MWWVWNREIRDGKEKVREFLFEGGSGAWRWRWIWLEMLRDWFICVCDMWNFSLSPLVDVLGCYKEQLIPRRLYRLCILPKRNVSLADLSCGCL